MCGKEGETRSTFENLNHKREILRSSCEKPEGRREVNSVPLTPQIMYTKTLPFPLDLGKFRNMVLSLHFTHFFPHQLLLNPGEIVKINVGCGRTWVWIKKCPA